MANKLISGFLILLLMFLIGCAATPKTLSSLDYSQAAHATYEDALRTFERERWTEAQSAFAQVKTDYPYSKYASLAELRMADCSFNLGSHAEAAVGYQHFIKLYPTHPEAHYAAFKKGESYYAQIPSDWVLTPPSYEKDQTATRDARAALAYFLRGYKDSKYIPKAQKLYEDVEGALIRHEMYVAAFYLRRDKKKAAAVRLESVERQFPNSPVIPDAMFLKAITLLNMGKKDEAIHTFRTIIAMWENDPQAKRAKRYLDAFQALP